MTVQPAERIAGGLTLAVGAIGVATFGTMSFAALAPRLRTAFELSPAGVGLLGSGIFAGALLSTLPAGRLTDRVGAPRMLAMALLGIGLALVLASVATTPAVLFTGVALAGLSYGAVNPATNVLATANVPASRRATTMGIKQTGVTLGGVLAGIVLPTVAAVFGGWREALLVPLAAAIATSAYAGWVRWPFGAAVTRSRPPSPAGDHGGSPSRVGMAVYGFLMAGVQITLFSYLAVYLVDTRGASATVGGLGLAVALFGGTCGRLAWGVISDRWLPERTSALLLAAAGSALAIGALPVVPAAAVWPLLALVGFFSVGWNGVFLTSVTEGAGRGRIGRATGAALWFLYAGGVSLPPVFGLLLSASSWRTSWTATAALVACGCAVLWLGTHRGPISTNEA